MDKKIVLIGAGSTSFGPSMFTDLYLSDILEGSTVMLHDLDEEKLEIIYELLTVENKKRGNKFNLNRTTNRTKALKNADFIINSIEVGNRMKLWWQDYNIPRKYGSTQVLGECGGPGGTFHAFRVIPPIIEIVKDVEKICPDAFFINFSNPMSRVCLAIKRATKDLKFVGLCHQIGFMDRNLPRMLHDIFHKDPIKDLKHSERKKKFDATLENLKMTAGGLNHFAFLFGLEDRRNGEDLMPEFNKRAINYFKEREDSFEFSALTFEVYKRFKFFPYVGDNHLGEFLQFGEEFTQTEDLRNWIKRTEQRGDGIYKRVLRYYKRLKRDRYPRKGLLQDTPSGERAVPIIEAIIQNKNSYESAVNIPNAGLIKNLPKDLVVEVSAFVDKDGVHGKGLGKIPKDIAAILRIEATIQDLCIEAILNRSKRLAINCLAIDPNVGSFETAENIYNEMAELQKHFLPKFL
ncbi:MAG: hypothetical protein GF353_04545 [Candidatus Lokiarchaeota archaeon]|nr:hypothetical protein [Candidatus Lokiarchaeota archaeon]